MSLDTLAAWLLTYWLHSTVLLVAAAVATRWLVHSDAWRETLWKTALLGGLLTASVQFWSGAVPLSGRWDLVTTAASAPVRSVEPATEPATPVHESSSKADAPLTLSSRTGGETDRPVPSAAAPERLDVPWMALALGTWALGAMALVLRLLGRHRRLGHLLADRRRVREPNLAAVLTDLEARARMWRTVRLSASARCATPLALGVSEICLPERLLVELGPEEQRGALAHEVAHLARNDPAWQLTAALLESVFFFQPLNRLARRRLRDAAEHLCDDWAVRQTGSPIGLARCLAEVAAWVGHHPERVPEGTLAMAEHGSALLRRVERLLGKSGRDRRQGGGARTVVAGGLLAVVGLAAPVVGTDRRSDEPSDSRWNVESAVNASPEPQQAVIRHPDPSQPLEARWAWALGQAGERNDREIWVAWGYPSQVPPGQVHVTDTENWTIRGFRGRAITDLLDVPEGPELFIAILAVSVRGDDVAEIRRVAGRSAAIGFPFGARTVYWLGPAADAESFRFLRAMFRRTDHAGQRESLVDLLAVHRTADSVVPFLRDVLASRDTEVIRAEAAEGLEWHPTATSVAILRDVALRDGSTQVRAEAAEALGEIRRDDARDALADLIRSNPPPHVGQEAVESLAGHSNERTLELLSEVAFGRHPREIQREAVETIGELNVAGVPGMLERIARTHPDPDVRGEALDALGDVDDEVRIRVLADVIRDGGSERMRRDAVDALGDRGDPATLETLVRVALDDPSSGVQREAVEKLENFTPSLVAPHLRRIAFEASRMSTRRQAAETLGDLPADAALPVLDDIIANHPDRDVVTQAVESLGNYPASVSLERLEAILRTHPSVEVRREALDQMENLGAFRDGDRGRPGG